MLTNEEMRAVTEQAQADILAELADMWQLPAEDFAGSLTPGMVRAVLRVLARDYGIRRAGTIAEKLEGTQAEPLDAGGEDPAWPPPSRIPPATSEPLPGVVKSKIYAGKDVAPHVATLPATNGHAPAKRVANLDAPPVQAPPAPAKRPAAVKAQPASLWARKLDLTGDLAALVASLETGETSWRTVHNDQRHPIVLAVLRWMKANGWRLTQAEATRVKPDWLPTATAWCMALDVSWEDLVNEASA